MHEFFLCTCTKTMPRGTGHELTRYANMAIYVQLSVLHDKLENKILPLFLVEVIKFSKVSKEPCKLVARPTKPFNLNFSFKLTNSSENV